MMIAVAGVMLAMWSAADALVGATRDRAPEVALRVYPNDPLALARSAAAESELRGSGVASPAAQRKAQRSLRSLDLNPRALRVAAMADLSRNDDQALLRTLTAAEHVTRRDLPIQLMLVEAAVARGDVAGALSHYDRALRVTPEAGTLLFPTLTSAVQDPGAGPAVLALIGSRPPWLGQLVDWIAHYSPSVTPLLPILFRIPANSPALVAEQQRFLVARLVKDNDIRGASALYRHLRGREPRSEGLLAFETALPPLDWEVETEGDRSGIVQASSGSLGYYVDGNAFGKIARRVLTLPPGRYSFGATGTSDMPDRTRHPFFTVRCIGGDRDLMRVVAVPVASAMFVVPTGCANQWLTLATGVPADQSQSGDIRAVAIRKFG